MSAAVLENIIPTSLFMLFSTVSDPQEKSLVNRWRKEYEQTTAKKTRRQNVLRAVGEGYDTLREIAAATDVPQTTCFRLLKQFEKENKVRRLIVEIEKEVYVSKDSVKRVPFKELRFELI